MSEMNENRICCNVVTLYKAPGTLIFYLLLELRSPNISEKYLA